MNKPLAIDLYAGLGGWCEGLQTVGYRVVGFDNVRHDYGTGGYPSQLVLQDVLTLHGSQFKDAALIVASPPCQFFSYTAMPWTRAKKLAADTRADPLVLEKELSLFNACFRLQREACEAAGRHIPLVVENVCGAQKWVGRAKWHYGSFYLWGDVPALMPSVLFKSKLIMDDYKGKRRTVDGLYENGLKVASFRFDGSGKSFQSAAVDSFGWSKNTPLRNNNSHSSARKAASAMIAKIPRPLAEWIGRVYYPEEKVA